MITKKKFQSIKELQELQRIASHCPDGVGLHSEDGTVMIDAKSFIGLYTLNFQEPILVVSENEAFHKAIAGIGETL